MDVGAWFLVGCALAALMCTAVGIVSVLRAAATVKRHAKEIVPEQLLVKIYAAEAAAERLQGALALAESLVPRVTAALESIAASKHTLRRVFSIER